MRSPPPPAAPWRQWLVLGLTTIVTGCAHLAPVPPDRSDSFQMHPTRDAKSVSEVQALQTHLASLAPTVQLEESERVAICAWDYSLQLAREYGVAGPPLFHNFLVNVGIKKRGLCYQWAEDLLAKLRTLDLATLQLHWGIARAGTYREHNCIVVTAPGQPFADGIVLDAWRHSGRLVWAKVATDRYPWQEGVLDLEPVPAQPR